MVNERENIDYCVSIWLYTILIFSAPVVQRIEGAFPKRFIINVLSVLSWTWKWLILSNLFISENLPFCVFLCIKIIFEQPYGILFDCIVTPKIATKQQRKSKAFWAWNLFPVRFIILKPVLLPIFYCSFYWAIYPAFLGTCINKDLSGYLILSKLCNEFGQEIVFLKYWQKFLKPFSFSFRETVKYPVKFFVFIKDFQNAEFLFRYILEVVSFIACEIAV